MGMMSGNSVWQMFVVWGTVAVLALCVLVLLNWRW